MLVPNEHTPSILFGRSRFRYSILITLCSASLPSSIRSITRIDSLSKISPSMAAIYARQTLHDFRARQAHVSSLVKFSLRFALHFAQQNPDLCMISLFSSAGINLCSKFKSFSFLSFDGYLHSDRNYHFCVWFACLFRIGSPYWLVSLVILVGPSISLNIADDN